MEKLYIPPTDTCPEISMNTDPWELSIRGNSAPEDVRSLYYPVLDWIHEMVNHVLKNPGITGEAGVRMTMDMKYFNSPSAKFLHDILTELARLKEGNCSLEIRWIYETEDVDMEEAGQDMAAMSGINFIYLPK